MTDYRCPVSDDITFTDIGDAYEVNALGFIDST